MARLSFEIGTLLDGKTLVEDVAFHMGLPLERNTQAPDRSDNVAAHNYILGRNTARHLDLSPSRSEPQRMSPSISPVDLDLAFRCHIASDRQVLADN